MFVKFGGNFGNAAEILIKSKKNVVKMMGRM